MPRFNGRGPLGQGPLTGWGNGRCRTAGDAQSEAGLEDTKNSATEARGDFFVPAGWGRRGFSGFGRRGAGNFGPGFGWGRGNGFGGGRGNSFAGGAGRGNRWGGRRGFGSPWFCGVKVPGGEK